MKTSELTGLQLDYAVALIEGQVKYGAEDFREQRKHTVESGEYVYRYSTSWAQGGPIIEREGICLVLNQHRNWDVHLDNVNFFETGETPLIAAMRCYVTSKLGDEIDIPEELL